MVPLNARLGKLALALPPDIRSAPLTPVQAEALVELEVMLDATPIVVLAGAGGSGRSTILAAIAERRSGHVVKVSDLIALTASRPADYSDAAIGLQLLKLLDRTDFLIIDNFGSMTFNAGARPGFMTTVIVRHLQAEVVRRGKSLLFAGDLWNQFSVPSDQYGHNVGIVSIGGFAAGDYERFAINIAGAEKAGSIDFHLVFRFASVLNGHQLRMACRLVAREDLPTAKSFIDILLRHGITVANTRTDQVEALDLASLPGHEHIVKRLMTHIILPLENHALADRLGLKAKRGVLLFGPPGTGKTSIGRALAHRMKGKFFIVDGSFVSEPPAAFFAKVTKIVEEAKANAPSVLFIDDADILFQIEHIAGLSRYLLSLLDGLESEKSNRVCVMMTAMNVRHIPEALLRSGRVELWLETRLPTEAARGLIIKRWMSDDLPGGAPIDYAALAAATEGFTPADLRRLIGDAKALYSIDLVRRREPVSTIEYIHRAIRAIIDVRHRMATTLRDESLRIGADPAAGYGGGVGGMAASGTCGVGAGW